MFLFLLFLSGLLLLLLWQGKSEVTTSWHVMYLKRFRNYWITTIKIYYREKTKQKIRERRNNEEAKFLIKIDNKFIWIDCYWCLMFKMIVYNLSWLRCIYLFIIVIKWCMEKKLTTPTFHLYCWLLVSFLNKYTKFVQCCRHLFIKIGILNANNKWREMN